MIKHEYIQHEHIPWFYKDEPCDVIAVGVERGYVCALFVTFKGCSHEIMCRMDSSGDFPDLVAKSH